VELPFVEFDLQRSVTVMPRIVNEYTLADGQCVHAIHQTTRKGVPGRGKSPKNRANEGAYASLSTDVYKGRRQHRGFGPVGVPLVDDSGAAVDLEAG
jgi:hypothetical protein